jgi:hypothetical protein
MMLESRSTYNCSIKDGEVFLAWTERGDYGLGKREGHHYYFNGEREDLFRNRITRWYPLPGYYSEIFKKLVVVLYGGMM